MQQLFREVSYRTSKLITVSYSTSFSIAVSYLEPEIREAIYSIYGFVRLADEIVDSFHDYNQEKLISQFERDYYEAVENRISLNPALNAFQETVRKFGISDELTKAFMKSMKADLVKSVYNTRNETDEYVYGSAEVVGLMCLMVFVRGMNNCITNLRNLQAVSGQHSRKLIFSAISKMTQFTSTGIIFIIRLERSSVRR
jgi:15-cis-phytoene synthase